MDTIKKVRHYFLELIEQSKSFHQILQTRTEGEIYIYTHILSQKVQTEIVYTVT